MIDQTEWGAQRVFDDYDIRPSYSSDDNWNPTEYVIHYGGNDVTGAYLGVEREKQVLRIYEQSHLSRGWRAIAYNYAFGNSGETYRLRGENPPGATKYHNQYTKSLLWIGGGTQQPTVEAFAAVTAFIAADRMPTNPHSFYRPTKCPGDYWRDWIEDMSESAPNIDECSPWQTTAWQKASDFGILTVDSHPQEPLTKGDLMVFLNRLNLFNGGE